MLKVSIISETVRKNYKNLNIIYGINQTPFGEVLIAKTEKGICFLQFINDKEKSLNKLFNRCLNSSFIRNDIETEKLAKMIFYDKNKDYSFKLDVAGTDFQLKVWKELLKIPKNALFSYSQLAKSIGQPLAVRAVGNAAGKNPVHYLIPCHKVIRSNGQIGGYAAGVAIKQALIEAEQSITPI